MEIIINKNRFLANSIYCNIITLLSVSSILQIGNSAGLPSVLFSPSLVIVFYGVVGGSPVTCILVGSVSLLLPISCTGFLGFSD